MKLIIKILIWSILSLRVVSINADADSVAVKNIDPCVMLSPIKHSSGWYFAQQQIRIRPLDRLQETTISIPPQFTKLSRPQYQKNYLINSAFKEVSKRYRTLDLSNDNISKKTEYKFVFTFQLSRKDKENLPEWAKEMKEQPIAKCHFFKDGESLIVKSTYYNALNLCELNINKQTIPKVAGAKFIEVRAIDRAGEEFYRVQYTLHHPDIVKNAIAALSIKLNDAMKANQCKPS
jgi:hypothetical protein